MQTTGASSCGAGKHVAGLGETISYYSQNFAVVVSHELVHAKVSFRDILFEYDFISILSSVHAPLQALLHLLC